MSYEDGPCGGYGNDEPYYCPQAGCLCYGGDCWTCQQQQHDEQSYFDTNPFSWMDECPA